MNVFIILYDDGLWYKRVFVHTTMYDNILYTFVLRVEIKVKVIPTFYRSNDMKICSSY